MGHARLRASKGEPYNRQLDFDLKPTQCGEAKATLRLFQLEAALPTPSYLKLRKLATCDCVSKSQCAIPIVHNLRI